MNYSKKISVAAILTIAMLSSCIKDKDLSQITNIGSDKGSLWYHRITMDQRYRRPAAKQALCLRNI